MRCAVPPLSEVMETKKVFVKYACKCANCECELRVGDPAYFEIVQRKMFCVSCAEAEQPEPTTKPTAQNVPEDRESRMQRMHDENMKANAVLVEAILKLAAEVGWLSEKMKFPKPPGGS